MIAGLVLAACLVTACYDDKGNYDYVALNEISVDTAGISTTYTLEQYDSLHIVPELRFTQGPIPEEKLAYKWVIFTDNFANAESEMEVLSTEKELHMQVTQSAKTESYAIIYYVTHLDDNTVWQQKYTLIVQPSVVSGIVALHTLDGQSDIDYIATTNAVPGVVENKWLKNILFSTVGRKPFGKSRFGVDRAPVGIVGFQCQFGICSNRRGVCETVGQGFLLGVRCQRTLLPTTRCVEALPGAARWPDSPYDSADK